MYEIVKDNFSVAEFSTMTEAVEHIKYLPAGRYIVRHYRYISDDLAIAPRLGNIAVNKR
jgi:hypothetical protein